MLKNDDLKNILEALEAIARFQETHADSGFAVFARANVDLESGGLAIIHDDGSVDVDGSELLVGADLPSAEVGPAHTALACWLLEHSTTVHGLAVADLDPVALGRMPWAQFKRKLGRFGAMLTATQRMSLFKALGPFHF